MRSESEYSDLDLDPVIGDGSGNPSTSEQTSPAPLFADADEAVVWMGMGVANGGGNGAGERQSKVSAAVTFNKARGRHSVWRVARLFAGEQVEMRPEEEEEEVEVEEEKYNNNNNNNNDSNDMDDSHHLAQSPPNFFDTAPSNQPNNIHNSSSPQNRTTSPTLMPNFADSLTGYGGVVGRRSGSPSNFLQQPPQPSPTSPTMAMAMAMNMNMTMTNMDNIGEQQQVQQQQMQQQQQVQPVGTLEPQSALSLLWEDDAADTDIVSADVNVRTERVAVITCHKHNRNRAHLFDGNGEDDDDDDDDDDSFVDDSMKLDEDVVCIINKYSGGEGTGCEIIIVNCLSVTADRSGASASAVKFR